MVVLQILTGMRPGEACLMRGRDLIRDDSVWTYRPASHKTLHRGRQRSIPLGPQAVDMLEEFLKTDPEAYLFDPRDAVAAHHANRGKDRETRPTPSEVARRSARPGSAHNARYGRKSYLNAIARACDRAFPHSTIRKKKGVPLAPEDAATLVAWRKAYRWHPNQLRHAVATLIRGEFGLETAQVVLGHSRADVTQVYAEQDLQKAREIMKKIG